MADTWTWMAESAPSERAMLEAFFLWIYTARAHADGFVDAVIEEALAFAHPQSPEGFAAPAGRLAPPRHATTACRRSPCRRSSSPVPRTSAPRSGSAASSPSAIPGAELVVLPGEAHQPFQEQPDDFNTLVADFWSRVDAA